ncbi:recombinase family protein [Actinomadura sp. 3N508]|uniref:recombinase family protein n=1 Tax=Actinomadura sp. 3N508 TaxID=3375153 RepID=UPI00379B4BA4
MSDEPPIYDEHEQGLSGDRREWAPGHDERQVRLARDKDARQRLISKLSDGGAIGEVVGRTHIAEAALSAASESSHIFRVVIYLRVSTEEQASVGGEAEGYSIPAQRDACLGKAQAMHAIVVEQYIDAGESAKSARRPDLQRMLHELKGRRIDYVIVHKIDRLARNRADDVEINAAIAKAGAKLVSVSEPVDDTPAGRLLYNMMADVAQYHSDNLGVEVLKGMNKKAETGGTPYRSPLGYLNVQEVKNGEIIRDIIVDPQRGSLIRWMLLEYATGEWTVIQLADALNAQGLRTRGGKKTVGKPISPQTIHRLLTNPYFFGVVPYRGVFHEGKHEALISPETWLRIQEVLRSHNYVGEKTRQHPHYLKSSIFCGECGSRLVYSRNKGRNDYYEYFICINRRTKRNPCSRTSVRLEKIEVGIARFYAGFRIAPHHVKAIQEAVRQELASERQARESAVIRARKQLEGLGREREKLLQAHYADAVPLDLMKREMVRITRETVEAEQAIQGATQALGELDDTLARALVVAVHCERQYVTAPPKVRRQINQGLFQKLYIGRDGEVERCDLTEPFVQMLDPPSAMADAQMLPDEAAASGVGVDSSDGVRPASLFRALYGGGGNNEEDRPGAIFNGLHKIHLVPPTVFEPGRGPRQDET